MPSIPLAWGPRDNTWSPCKELFAWSLWTKSEINFWSFCTIACQQWNISSFPITLLCMASGSICSNFLSPATKSAGSAALNDSHPQLFASVLKTSIKPCNAVFAVFTEPINSPSTPATQQPSNPATRQPSNPATQQPWLQSVRNAQCVMHSA